MDHKLLISTDPASELRLAIEELSPQGVYVLTDENTVECAYPLIRDALGEHHLLSPIPAGDENKTIDTSRRVWEELSDLRATRSSLLVNLGGGVVSDLGGFVAATFKRGMSFINVPTTLLSAVDAAVGGKTGVNLNGLKNQIGVFRHADRVVVSPEFYVTLPQCELLSGYAEVIKHAFLDTPQSVAEVLDMNPVDISSDQWVSIIRDNIRIKQRIVSQDPTETGIRKALNLGHTAGHAFEEFAMQSHTSVPHGYAVAWGLVVAIVLSHTRLGFDSTWLHHLALYIKEYYGCPPVECKDYDRLLELMRHDKKNVKAGEISFTLLSEIGAPEINQIIDPDDIRMAFDIARDLLV